LKRRGVKRVSDSQRVCQAEPIESAWRRRLSMPPTRSYDEVVEAAAVAAAVAFAAALVPVLRVVSKVFYTSSRRGCTGGFRDRAARPQPPPVEGLQ
jgi:hypothetical protein